MDASSAFALIDSNASGTITPDEMLIHMLSKGMAEEDTSALFRALDTDNSGEITMAEFTAGLATFHEVLGTAPPPPNSAPVEIVAAEDGDTVAPEQGEAAASPLNQAQVLAAWEAALLELSEITRGLTKSEITEIQALARPPAILETVLTSVCRLFMRQPPEGTEEEQGAWWRVSQRLLLTDPHAFMVNLQTGLIDLVEPHCTQAVIADVKESLAALEEEGGVEKSKKASRVGEVCHLWVCAFVKAWDAVGGEAGMTIIRRPLS